MAKLSKRQLKVHKEIEHLIQKDVLTTDEREMILKQYFPASATNVTDIAAFFTPYDLAWDFRLEVPTGARVLDLCAGIGALSYPLVNLWDESMRCEVVCVERSQRFCDIGQKVVPQATWYCHDALDIDFLKTLGKFDYVISNPPFGKIKTSDLTKGLRYQGSDFEYKIIDIADQISPNNGAFIIPASSAPFKFSGARCYERLETSKYLKFREETGIDLDAGVGIDCSIYRDEWQLTSPAVEIVCITDGYK